MTYGGRGGGGDTDPQLCVTTRQVMLAQSIWSLINSSGNKMWWIERGQLYIYSVDTDLAGNITVIVQQGYRVTVLLSAKVVALGPRYFYILFDSAEYFIDSVATML